ncbi:hypothetical protein Ahy_A02g005056 isoform F [Arachis hypogaea]|uniref:R13L1/DRL21-like LRR repeat region domain-containing protein n=1 Tax=Arachis hypogaea TaxID=3818 RepID=A0A445E5J1_ARAHY|nr:hypothetical protein Ahy_A02g005056 isoform F [Arachis hypogaea]
MVTRIEEIIARLEDIAKHKDILRLEKIAAKNMSGRIPSTSLVKKSDIFVGRHKERDTINAAKHDAKTRHFSCACKNEDDLLMKITEACDKLKHARTLLQIFNKYDDENLMHGSIAKLIHLRYLDLSYTSIVTLPESLSCLYNLQTLKLRSCVKLKKLPSNMQNLVNLRHLDSGGTDLEEMPKKMSKLKDLQFLSDYIVGKHEENGIGELGGLTHLHGSLWIPKLENVKNGGEASSARMDEKIHLNALYLSWSSFEESEVCDSQSEKDVLEKLRPHKDLKELFIWRYRGTMFPDWVGHSSYHKMTWLELWGCRNCWVVPSLGQLPSLERLVIAGFNKVKKIGGSFYKGCEELGCYLPRAPILRELRIDGKQEARMRDLPLSMLERVWVNGEQQVEYVIEAMTHTQLTSLIELQISECSSAISFPGDSLPPLLKELRIYNCKNVEFPMQHQQHHSLQTLEIHNSCDSLTSFALPSFPNLKYLTISECPKLENITRLPGSLRELIIRACPLLGEGIERKDPHIWPSISHIPDIYVDRRRIRNDSTS